MQNRDIASASRISKRPSWNIRPAAIHWSSSAKRTLSDPELLHRDRHSCNDHQRRSNWEISNNLPIKLRPKIRMPRTLTMDGWEFVNHLGTTPVCSGPIKPRLLFLHRYCTCMPLLSCLLRALRSAIFDEFSPMYLSVADLASRRLTTSNRSLALAACNRWKHVEW